MDRRLWTKNYGLSTKNYRLNQLLTYKTSYYGTIENIRTNIGY